MRYQAENTTWLCSELVTLVVDNATEISEKPANLEQISSSSALLLTDEKTENSGSVILRVQGHELRGRTVSTERDPVLGWFVTVRFDNAVRWCPELFMPKHAIRVDALARVAANAA